MKKLLLILLCMSMIVPAAVMAEETAPAQFALTSGTATLHTVENGKYVAAKEYVKGTWAQVLSTNRALYEVVMQDGTVGFMDGDDLIAEDKLGELRMLLEDEDGLVNIRLSASLKSRVSRYQKAEGRAVSVLEAGEKFSLCSYNGIAEGYIINTRLGDAKMAEVVSQSGARLRKGPGMAYEQIRMVSRGADVIVLVQGTRWCKVEYKGNVGFISVDSLAL